MNHLKYFKLDQKSISIFLQNIPTFLNTRLQADASFGIARVWTDGEAGGDGGGGGEDDIDIIHNKTRLLSPKLSLSMSLSL